VREFDHPDLADPALHLHLCDPKNPIVVFASVGGVNTYIAEMFEAKSFEYVDG
jgi:hypothetical protein